MKDKFILNTAVSIILLLLLAARIFLDEENSQWIQYIGFIGVIIALVDLYLNSYKQSHDSDKFKVVLGIAVVVSGIISFIVVAMILNILVLDAKGNDCMTILALLISLPSDLYCAWIDIYVRN